MKAAGLRPGVAPRGKEQSRVQMQSSLPGVRVSRNRSGSFFRDVLAIVGLLILLIPASASAQPLPIVQPTTAESIAFARYIAWLHARDPFTESGPVALAIA